MSLIHKQRQFVYGKALRPTVFDAAISTPLSNLRDIALSTRVHFTERLQHIEFSKYFNAQSSLNESQDPRWQ